MKKAIFSHIHRIVSSKYITYGLNVEVGKGNKGNEEQEMFLCRNNKIYHLFFISQSRFSYILNFITKGSSLGEERSPPEEEELQENFPGKNRYKLSLMIYMHDNVTGHQKF